MLPYRLVKCTFTGYLVTLYVTSLLFFVTQSCHELREVSVLFARNFVLERLRVLSPYFFVAKKTTFLMLLHSSFRSGFTRLSRISPARAMCMLMVLIWMSTYSRLSTYLSRKSSITELMRTHRSFPSVCLALQYQPSTPFRSFT